MQIKHLNSHSRSKKSSVSFFFPFEKVYEKVSILFFVVVDALPLVNLEVFYFASIIV